MGSVERRVRLPRQSEVGLGEDPAARCEQGADRELRPPFTVHHSRRNKAHQRSRHPRLRFGDRALSRLREGLPDHRKPRGIRHPIESVVAVATASALAGASSFDAIGQFAVHLPREVLGKLGCKWNERRGSYVPPSPDTIGRLLSSLDADRLDQVVGRWLSDQAVTAEKAEKAQAKAAADKRDRTDLREPLIGIAVDGKWLRGSGRVEQDQVKLFSGMLHRNGAVVGQTKVGDDDSTCELNSMRPLLKRLGDLAGKVVTADALHCQRDHAVAIVEGTTATTSSA
jgi:hypothetical protein